MNDNTLILIRGVPGSGKSTFAKMLTNNIAEADMYFESSGQYEWNSKEVKTAHKWCFARTIRFMKEGRERIAVANTFTRERELDPYIELANQYGYDVVSIIMENRHESKSVHDVPEETIAKMRNRLMNNILV